MVFPSMSGTHLGTIRVLERPSCSVIETGRGSKFCSGMGLAFGFVIVGYTEDGLLGRTLTGRLFHLVLSSGNG
jgi:hypothetical protein